MTNFTAGNELCVNGRWFFDVVGQKDESVTVRVKYKEAPNKQFYLYKEVKLPSELITITETSGNVLSCQIDPKKLKTLWGSLVDRLVKEPNPYSMRIQEATTNEDAAATAGNTAGMGAVSNPGLSGTPGVPGSAGSGDVSIGRTKRYYMNGTDKDKSQGSVKRAMMDILGMTTEDLNPSEETENDYKKLVYQFVEWPWTADAEADIVREVNTWKAEFLSASSARIREYFKQLWELNSSLAKAKCSEPFVNQFMTLAGTTA